MVKSIIMLLTARCRSQNRSETYVCHLVSLHCRFLTWKMRTAAHTSWGIVKISMKMHTKPSNWHKDVVKVTYLLLSLEMNTFVRWYRTSSTNFACVLVTKKDQDHENSLIIWKSSSALQLNLTLSGPARPNFCSLKVLRFHWFQELCKYCSLCLEHFQPHFLLPALKWSTRSHSSCFSVNTASLGSPS